MSRVRQLPGGGRAVEVSASRLPGWFDRFSQRHNQVRYTCIAAQRVEVHATDGALAAIAVPFGELPPPYGEHVGLQISSLVEHVRRPRRIALILVRLGAHSIGIGYDGVLERSTTDRHYVHGKNKAGGWSQQRFARRREEQSRRSLDSAAEAVARVVLPESARLDAVVLGGDKQALNALRADPRLAALLDRAEPRVLDVPEPRRAVLNEAARRASAVEIEVRDG